MIISKAASWNFILSFIFLATMVLLFSNLDRAQGISDIKSFQTDTGILTDKVQSRPGSDTALQSIAADLFQEQRKVIASDSQTSARFGIGVAVSGDTAVIGAQFDNAAAQSSGAAYIFERDLGGPNNWGERKKLIASDAAAADNFGFAVAIDGDTVVIGTNNGQGTGSAYIFERNAGGANNWGETKILDPSTCVAGCAFGNWVSISGDSVLAGAPIDGPSGVRSGSAFIFERNTGGANNWGEVKKLIASDGAAGDIFGSVSINGDTAIVGALQNLSRGAAYVFERDAGGANNWGETKKLIASDAHSGDAFGQPSISGDTVVIGADLAESLKGAAYVFERNSGGANNWGEIKKLTASNGAQFNEFGLSVGISSDTVVVGAFKNLGTGSAYIYGRNTGGTDNWGEIQRINASDAQSNDIFGVRVAVSGTTVLVGAATEDEGGTNSGAAYLFESVSTTDSTKFDFDGDSKADHSIFRPGAGQWWFLRSSDGGNGAAQFGTSIDKPVPADFTGDGIADIAFWRESTGEWFILRSEDGSFFSFPFGSTGDLPAPGDYDGDGKADAAVFRASVATWFINRSSDGNTDIIGFGVDGDQPVIADYDGDGKDDIAIFRSSASQWWIVRSTDGLIAFQFGAAGDKTVQGDYTGDGKADVAFFRPSNGNWFVLRSEDSSFFSFPFGVSSDLPTPGDYDGDGIMDPAVFRPKNSTWFIIGSTSGLQIQGFGTAGDIPLPSVYVRQ